MERLTRPDVDVTEYADKFLNTRLKGKEIDWKRTNDAGIDLLINAITCDEFSKDVFRQMARDLYGRLKQFEDTGMTPEQVVNAKTIIKSAFADDTSKAERIRKLLAADDEGRVVVLPCKVGDTVYTINLHKEIVDLTVDCFGIDETGELWIFTEDHNKTYVDAFEIRDIDDDVFLTREEAERAMEG